jgi:NAD(P)-dependent dehydrogenase (short-subunit alcohol dehydrogenase family)
MKEGEVVLITGASGGLGETVAHAFANDGRRLVLVARRLEPLEVLALQLGLPEGHVLCRAADLSQPEQAREVVDATLERFGRVDCLVNLVGTWTGGVKVADLTDALWHDMLGTNLHAAFYIGRAVLPAMLAQSGGRIIHIGSRAVERPGSGQAPYNVSKSGLVALTRSIAADYGAQGIRANIILPGTILPAHQSSARPGTETLDGVSPADLAQVMLLLCGPSGPALNGAAIPVYGGRPL